MANLLSFTFCGFFGDILARDICLREVMSPSGPFKMLSVSTWHLAHQCPSVGWLSSPCEQTPRVGPFQGNQSLAFI